MEYKYEGGMYLSFSFVQLQIPVGIFRLNYLPNGVIVAFVANTYSISVVFMLSIRK